MNTLLILNFNERRIRVSQKVKEEMSRLRTQAVLKPCILFLYNLSDTSNCKIFFYNVRSLHLNIDDVSRDDNVKTAHLYLLKQSYVDMTTMACKNSKISTCTGMK